MLRRAGSNILYLGCPEECGSETKEGRCCVNRFKYTVPGLSIRERLRDKGELMLRRAGSANCTWAVQRSAAPRPRRAEAA